MPVYSRFDLFSVNEARHIFPRMIRSGISGITAMICRDHQHIIIPHIHKELSQLFIKSRKCSGISFDITPVSLDHIPVYQVHITKSIEIFLLYLDRLFHILFVSLIRIGLCHALPFKDIVDLSDTDHIFSFCF